MIPVGDSIRSRTFSYVNYALILTNIIVFLYELSLGSTREQNLFFFDWGAVPVDLKDFAESPTSGNADVLVTPFTAMFIHGGWLHLLGNMVYLWVFGDNVEDSLGHIRYLAFYLMAGLAGTALQVFMDSNSQIPTVGASGAIAGVLGAYIVLYPRAMVTIYVPILIFFTFAVPAAFLIGAWFVMQVLSGAATIGYAVGAEGGVAWWAHVGGFASGFVMVWVLRRRERVPERYRW